MRKGQIGVQAIALIAAMSVSVAQAAAQAPAADQKKADAASSDEQRPKTLPAPTGKTTVQRWFDLQTASVLARYRRIETSKGVVSSNHVQDGLALKARIKFDAKAKYTLNAGLATGTSFTGGWNNVGWGTGGPRVTNLYVKQLFLAAAPVKGLDVSYGGLGFVRGESTEITTYDNDGYLVGARVSVKRPKSFHVDEISFTNGYVGDTTKPSFLNRYSRLDEANYRHLLVGRRIGKTLGLSADYTRLSGVDTARAAVNVKTPDAHMIDFVRYEQYKRFGATAAFGFAAYGEKALTKRVALGAGYADIDAKYGGLNADRFNKGRRLFEQATLKVTRDLSVSGFLTQAVHNSFAVSNKKRGDLVLTYNALAPIQRAGLFR
jgi:hypothetical protein